MRTKIARQKREREVILVDGKSAFSYLGIKGGCGSPFLLTRSTGLGSTAAFMIKAQKMWLRMKITAAKKGTWPLPNDTSQC